MKKVHDLCHATNQAVGGHSLNLLVLAEANVKAACQVAATAVPDHYASPERIAKILKQYGKKKAAKYLLQKIPTSVKTRSGDLGEILATEYIDDCTGYKAPIRRLRWKDNREMSMRGDDVIAVVAPTNSHPLKLLKAEVKSRAALKTKTIEEAREGLNRNGGLPSPHALEFVADRLLEIGNEKLADAITLALLNGISPKQVTNLLFTLSENAPDAFLIADLKGCSGHAAQISVGLRIPTHQKFIAAVFDAVETNHAV
jgi:hypothetical protein